MTHIAVDMDDVLVDFVGGLIEAVHTEYGVQIAEEQINQWDLHPLLDPIIGYSWWKWLKRREWLWANFPAVAGSIGTIERLRDEGHYIELVTSKPKWAEHNVWKWLGKWRPAFSQVTIVPTGQSKVHHTDAAILIDDKIENCIEFVAQGRQAILFDRPHNRNTPKIKELYYAQNWLDVYDLITERT